MTNLTRIIKSAGAVARTTAAAILPGRQAGKVFAIGFNKTGTTSLHHIFEELGYHSFHGTVWRRTKVTGFHYLYDSFCDGVPDDFTKLDRSFRGSKFILQVRNLDEWLDSRLEHINRMPNETGRSRTGNWTANAESVRAWVEKRNTYHTQVLRHFADRAEDFLLVNYIRDEDSAARISAFLGQPGKAQKHHSNKDPSGVIKKTERVLHNKDMIADVLTGMGIPEAEWKNDLLCPSFSVPRDMQGLPADSRAVTNAG